jgi:hypothetical protein
VFSCWHERCNSVVSEVTTMSMHSKFRPIDDAALDQVSGGFVQFIPPLAGAVGAAAMNPAAAVRGAMGAFEAVRGALNWEYKGPPLEPLGDPGGFGAPGDMGGQQRGEAGEAPANASSSTEEGADASSGDGGYGNEGADASSGDGGYGNEGDGSYGNEGDGGYGNEGDGGYGNEGDGGYGNEGDGGYGNEGDGGYGNEGDGGYGNEGDGGYGNEGDGGYGNEGAVATATKATAATAARAISAGMAAATSTRRKRARAPTRVRARPIRKRVGFLPLVPSKARPQEKSPSFRPSTARRKKGDRAIARSPGSTSPRWGYHSPP